MHRGLPQTRAFTAKAACCSACFLLTFLPAIASAGAYSGGSGTGAEPYRISSVPDWQELMATPGDWASHFVLTADIDLNDVPVIPIGSLREPFVGVFDGSGHIVHNADVNMPDSDSVGLFGRLGTLGQIKNLGVEDVSIFGRYDLGGLAGENYYGNISNCYSTGSVSGTSGVAGLAGDNTKGAITSCYSSCSVRGISGNAGGLVGHAWHGTVSNCYSTGSVTGGGSHVGGIVGYNVYGGIRNSHSTSFVSGADYVGGLVGQSYDGTVSNCYSAGSVVGREDVGGLMGYNYGSISNCYSTGSVSGGSCVGGMVGYNELSRISECCSTGWVSGTADFVGGMVGRDYRGTISNCYSTGTVTGGSFVGGLMGYSPGKISNCHSTGLVGGMGNSVGGLVGFSAAVINNCYSTGSAGAIGHRVGGLVGDNRYGTISNSYSTGSASGSSDVGGLVGYNYLGPISGSFWDVNTSRLTLSAGGTPKTTGEMKTQSTFISARWDFIGETANGTEDIWAICEGTNYPRFVYQIPQGDIVCPDGVNGLDYSILARYWHETECAALDDCEGADIDLSGAVDFGDVAAVAKSWLRDVR